MDEDVGVLTSGRSLQNNLYSINNLSRRKTEKVNAEENC